MYVSLHVSDTDAAAEAAAGTYFIPIRICVYTFTRDFLYLYTRRICTSHYNPIRKYFLFSLFVSSGEGETAVSYFLNGRQATPSTTVTPRLASRVQQSARVRSTTREEHARFTNTYLFP